MPAKLRANPALWALVPLFCIAAVFHTSRLLLKTRYDVIHAHWVIPQGGQAIIARIIARRGDVPVLITSHGADLFALNSRWLRWLKKQILRRAACLTVVSRAMRDRAREIAPDVDSDVAPMGIDARSLFKPAEVTRSQTELLYVGRLAEKKGVSTLLRALELLVEDHPEVTLSIAGAGPEELALRSLSDSLGLGRRVRFLGRLSHEALAPLYQRCAATVVPSIVAESGDEEGLGLTAVEAMACGSPVIASDLQGLRDVVADGSTGLLVKPGDPQALAKAISRVLEDPARASLIGRAASRDAKERFDWENVVRRYADLLHATAHGQSGN